MATIDTPRIFALLVGINDYPAPIPRLNGCLNDIRNVEQYLREHIAIESQAAKKTSHTPSNLSITQEGPLHLCILENEEATYTNIINAFREHLHNAGPEDVVWFHFSGHGTEGYTAKEFRETLEPNGKDQNLVCYAKNPEQEHFLLADKELAVLLHEVANHDTKASPPHIVVSLDCCHSGSGTRDSEWELTEITERTVSLQLFDTWEEAEATGALRELSSYLDGHFEKNPMALPLSEHILFSACTSIQTAGDTPTGGIFTRSLIETLTTANGPLNYADLFMRTRATVKQARKEQLPQFETIGGFDPYRQFLNGKPHGTPDLFEFIKEGNHWMIKCGAIHGIPVRPTSPITVEIKTFGSGGETLGVGHLTSVGAHKSKVTLADALTLDDKALYQAKITYLPLPALLVGIKGEEQAVKEIIEQWQDSLGIKWVTETSAIKEADLLVEVANEYYHVTDQRTQKQVYSLERTIDNAPKLIVSSLGKIVRWERTLALANEKSRIRSRVALEMEVLLNKNKKQKIVGETVVLDTASTDFIKHQDALVAGFLPQLVVKNTKQQLYCYLFHLRSDYSISAYEGGLVFRPDEHPGLQEVILPLLKEHKGWGLGADDKSADSYFKLFVTTEELDYQQLLQSGLGGDRAANWNWKPIGVSDEWCTLTMRIQLTSSI
ncbi:MAG: caspase family protein [Lewinella sp.]|uniref:caspase family protein n=1 Tax=Lewinella sp. TaxID=2004506 RepID=UPI003D6C4D56